MEENKSQIKSKNATITLIIIGIVIALGIVVSWINWKQSGNVQLKVGKEILSFDSSKNTQIKVIGSQIVKITQDGITAYNLNGDELWTDTLTIDSIVSRQRDEYIAVASRNGRQIHIFNEKGKQGQIVTKYPVVDFSINQNGQVAIIEQMEDSHQVSGYNERGEELGIKRVTYTKTDGYPMSVEISPDGSLLMASYVDMNSPKLTSIIVAIPVSKPQEEKVDQIKYGVKEQNNLVFEVEFISRNEWVSVGDTGTTFYSVENGEELMHLPRVYPTYIPYINGLPKSGGYLPLILGEMAQGTGIHNKEHLVIFDTKGKVLLKEAMNSPVTYYYADEKGVIVGKNRDFTGYSKMGAKKFEFKATQDIMSLVYVDRKVVAITKDKVLLLKEEVREK